MEVHDAKIRALLQDDAFVTQLIALADPASAQQALAGRGLQLSLPEVMALGKMLNAARDKGGELSEEELLQVSGGRGCSAPLFPIVLLMGDLGKAFDAKSDGYVNW